MMLLKRPRFWVVCNAYMWYLSGVCIHCVSLGRPSLSLGSLALGSLRGVRIRCTSLGRAALLSCWAFWPLCGLCGVPIHCESLGRHSLLLGSLVLGVLCVWLGRPFLGFWPLVVYVGFVSVARRLVAPPFSFVGLSGPWWPVGTAALSEDELILHLNSNFFWVGGVRGRVGTNRRALGSHERSN